MGDAEEAWTHLTPRTQQAAYSGDSGAFMEDVAKADWSSLRWTVGPVTDYEISWGAHIEIDPATAPRFLFESGIAGEFDDGILLLIQMNESGEYRVAGQGLDYEQP